MKYLRFIVYFIFCLVLVISCRFTDDYNVDPNATTSDVVTLDKRLPSLQFRMGTVFGRAFALRTGNIMGYVTYKQGPTGFNNYVFSPADASNINMWGDMYSTVFNQAFQINELALKENNLAYSGIAKIAMCYSIVTASTIWGDIPFSQASQAFNYPYPSFDSQELIYSSVQNMLSQAIKELEKADVQIKPSADDVIFGGDLNKWIKVAYALKARYYLHIVKLDESNYIKADSALQYALKSNEDNFIIRFETGIPDVSSPIYNERLSGDTDVDVSFGTLLRNTLADPREKFFAIVRGSVFSGVRATHGAFYGTQNSYVPILTYEECMFMKAEIEMRLRGKASAEPFLRDAVSASLTRVCSETVGSETNGDLATAIPLTVQAAYIQKVANIDSVQTDKDAWIAIFQQKYIAMFLQTESWNDYRRTEKYVDGIKGLPDISPRGDKVLPRRLFYPSSELNANPSAPPNISDIYQRVWWDTQ